MVHRSIRSGLFALFTLLSASAFSAPGDLDPAFGNGGVVRLDLGLPASARIQATTRLPENGKVIVAGTVEMPNAETGILLGRFTLDGALDTSFGQSGWTVLTQGLSEPTEVRGVATQSDGSIVTLVKSGARTGFGLRQADGSRYMTYNNQFEPDVRFDDWSAFVGFEPRALAIQQYGSYFVAGSAPADPATGRGRDTFVVRYGPSFNNEAYARYSIGADDDEALAISVVNPWGLHIGGRTREPGGSQDAYVARITDNLYPENFPVVRIDHAGGNESATVLTQMDGRILVGGRTEVPGGPGRFMVAAISLYGELALDTAFGTGGKTVVDMPAIFGGPHDATLKAIGVDGWIALTGNARDVATGDSRFAAAWLDNNGALMPTGQGGTGVAFGFANQLYGVDPRDDAVLGMHSLYPFQGGFGEYNVFGLHTSGGFQQLEVQRLRWAYFDDSYWNIRDSFYNPVPKAMPWKRPSADTLLGVVRFGDRIFALGVSDDDTVLARFRADGALDSPAYPNDPPAIRRLTPAEFPYEPASLAVDSMGRLVVGSRSNANLVVSRFDSALNFDYGFIGQPGVVRAAPGPVTSSVVVAVAPDDSIAIVGAYQDGGSLGLGAAKLDPFGGADEQWGPAIRTSTNTQMAPRAAAFGPDGQLLVVGGVPEGPAIVAKFAPSGILDPNWGTYGGWVTVQPTDPGLFGPAMFNALSIAGDGTFYASGSCMDAWKKYFCAAGFRPDGTFSEFGLQFAWLSGGDDEIMGSGLTPDGKLVVAGDSYRLSEFKAVAFHADGTRDGTFGPYGIALSNKFGVAMKAAMSPDGRLLLAGETLDDDWIMVQWQPPADTIPDAFTFGFRDDVASGSVHVSPPVTVTGLSAPAPIRASGGFYSIGCTGNYGGQADTIANGQTVCISHNNSWEPGSTTTSTVTIGGVKGTFATRVGTIPDTVIAQAPASPTASTEATFAFMSPNANVTFVCRLNGSELGACTSPYVLQLPPGGAFTFQVAAVNSAGTDQSPATHTWTVDTAAPEIIIDSQPLYFSTSPDVTVAFHANDTTSVTFECSLDGAPFAACASPVTYLGLTDDVHVLTLRATDAVGNTAELPTRWVVDTRAPDTSIEGPTLTNAATATFAFTSDEPSVSFECGVEGGSWLPCSSPFVIDNSLYADGSYPFRVRAKDAAGNVDTTPASWTLTIDRIAPDTSIGAAPSGTMSSTSASITFASPDGTAAFECRLDGAAFAACSSPAGYAGLAEGAHTFEVRARDAAGNVDASPAIASWTVDRTAPETSITGGPSGTVTQASASFAFSSPDAGAAFECSLDGAAWSACASPAAYSGLGDGTHLFEVRALDAVGNVDPSPASRTWSVDTTAPNTAIASGPDAVTSQTGATFTFSSNDGVTFACSLDGGAFGSCSSPVTYTGLAAGGHSFAVYATDSAGNPDPSPATWSWAIDGAAPETTIVSGPTDTVTQTSATLSFTSDDPAATFECRLDGAAFAACTSPVTLSGLSSASHTFEVRAKDAAGNDDPTPAVRTWTVDTVAPDTAITAAPAAAVNVTTASFSFTATEAASFECKLDAGAFAACTSPKSYTGLAVGSHTFQVRARDAVGNQDATPASSTWTIDTTAPNTTITSGPSGNNNPNTATFAFTSTEGGTFECKLDTGAFAACTTPKTYTGLARGGHTFQVRGKDAAGNVDASPASRTWSVK